jgi:hypothetical protein
MYKFYQFFLWTLLAKPCPQNMFHFFFFSSSASPSPQATDKLARLCLPRRGRRRHRQATDAKKKHARATTTGSHSREPKTKLLSIDTHGKTEASMCPFCSKEKSTVVATMPRCAMDRRLGQVRQKSTAGARRRLSTYVCTCSAPCFYTAGRKASQWRLPAGQRPDTTRPVHRLWIISAHATTSPKQSKTKRRDWREHSSPTSSLVQREQVSALISGGTGGHPLQNSRCRRAWPQPSPCHGPCRLVTSAPRQDQRYCYPR